MTLWISLAVMSLVAIGFAVWPLYKNGKGFSPLVGVTIVLVVRFVGRFVQLSG